MKKYKAILLTLIISIIAIIESYFINFNYKYHSHNRTCYI